MRIAIALALFAATLAAQVPTFRANVPVVLVPVTVADSKGRFVDGLTSADFSLLADGREQEFRLDAADAVVAPLAIVIAVQTNDLSAKMCIRDSVWGLHEDTDTRAIDNFIVRLRRYIEDDPTTPRHLLTVRGVGYRFVAAPE